MSQPRWVKIIAREMWDVPRAVAIPASQGTLLLDCPFDDARDEYKDEYTIYWLDGTVDISGSWNDLPRQADVVVGCVPIRQVRFDPQRRVAIDLDSLGDAIAKYTDRFAVVSSMD